MKLVVSGEKKTRHSVCSTFGTAQSFYRRKICLSNKSHRHQKWRKLGDLKVYATFELHFGDKFCPPLDTTSFQWTYLEQCLYGISNTPFEYYGHTGIFWTKKSIKVDISLIEQEVQNETKLVNVNSVHSLWKMLSFSCFIITFFSFS